MFHPETRTDLRSFGLRVRPLLHYATNITAGMGRAFVELGEESEERTSLVKRELTEGGLLEEDFIRLTIMLKDINQSSIKGC